MPIDPHDCPHPAGDVVDGICGRCNTLLLMNVTFEITSSWRAVLTVDQAREIFGFGEGSAPELLGWLRVLLQGLPARLLPLLPDAEPQGRSLPRLTMLNGKEPREWPSAGTRP